MRAILTYHAIDTSGSVISITPEVFQSHVRWLAGESVVVVGIAELLALPEEVNAVAITFDDALECVATEAAPLLAEHQLPATVFVVTDHIGGDNRWAGVTDPGIPVQPVLDWDTLGRLGETGWTIGSHTRRHPHLTRCSDTELHDELTESAAIIRERLGTRPTDFAYPYGDCDPRVTAAAAQHYAHSCTTHHLPIGADTAPQLIPRLDAWYFQHPEPFRGWGTRRFRRLIAWRHALRQVRRALR